MPTPLIILLITVSQSLYRLILDDLKVERRLHTMEYGSDLAEGFCLPFRNADHHHFSYRADA